MKSSLWTWPFREAYLEKMGCELGVSHCPNVALSQLSPKVPRHTGFFHHSSELAHATLRFVDTLLILFIEIPGNDKPGGIQQQSLYQSAIVA